MTKEIHMQDNKIDDLDYESLQEIAKDATILIPAMPGEISKPPEEQPNLVSDEMWHSLVDEALTNARKDREEASELMAKFADMAFNDGDASTSTKEAVVNLFKMKTDITDKIAKIADLATRVKLKERDTFPKFMAVHQNNTINTDRTPLTASEKRKLIERENKKLEKN